MIPVYPCSVTQSLNTDRALTICCFLFFVAEHNWKLLKMHGARHIDEQTRVVQLRSVSLPLVQSVCQYHPLFTLRCKNETGIQAKVESDRRRGGSQGWRLRWRTRRALAGGLEAPTPEAHAGYLSGKEPSQGGCFKAAMTDHRRAAFYHI